MAIQTNGSAAHGSGLSERLRGLAPPPLSIDSQQLQPDPSAYHRQHAFSATYTQSMGAPRFSAVPFVPGLHHRAEATAAVAQQVFPPYFHQHGVPNGLHQENPYSGYVPPDGIYAIPAAAAVAQQVFPPYSHQHGVPNGLHQENPYSGYVPPDGSDAIPAAAAVAQQVFPPYFHQHGVPNGLHQENPYSGYVPPDGIYAIPAAAAVAQQVFPPYSHQHGVPNGLHQENPYSGYVPPDGSDAIPAAAAVAQQVFPLYSDQHGVSNEFYQENPYAGYTPPDGVYATPAAAAVAQQVFPLYFHQHGVPNGLRQQYPYAGYTPPDGIYAIPAAAQEYLHGMQPVAWPQNKTIAFCPGKERLTVTTWDLLNALQVIVDEDRGFLATLHYLAREQHNLGRVPETLLSRIEGVRTKWGGLNLTAVLHLSFSCRSQFNPNFWSTFLDQTVLFALKKATLNCPELHAIVDRCLNKDFVGWRPWRQKVVQPEQ